MLHFMMDAYNTNEESINSLMSVYECLIDVVNSLGLKAVMPPFLVPYYYSRNMKDGGISAFVLLDGGHITIHTFPYRACYFVDVMAGDLFSTSIAKKELLACFNAQTVDIYCHDRRCVEINDEHILDPSLDFGPHYMITVQNTEMTFEGIFRWLDELAPKINMEAITRPYVIRGTIDDSKYISGVLVVAQSHVAVHYNIVEKTAYIDIFSCSFLENKQIENVLYEEFGDKATYKMFVRGSKYACSCQNDMVRIEKYSRWQKNKLL